MDKNIKEVFQALERPQTITEIAELSGVSRATIYNVRKHPERSALHVLRRIFKAMGYNIIITLERLEEPNELR